MRLSIDIRLPEADVHVEVAGVPAVEEELIDVEVIAPLGGVPQLVGVLDIHLCTHLEQGQPSTQGRRLDTAVNHRDLKGESSVSFCRLVGGESSA